MPKRCLINSFLAPHNGQGSFFQPMRSWKFFKRAILEVLKNTTLVFSEESLKQCNLKSDGQKIKACCLVQGPSFGYQRDGWNVRIVLSSWGRKEPSFNFDVSVQLGFWGAYQGKMVKESLPNVTLEESHSSKEGKTQAMLFHQTLNTFGKDARRDL